MDILQSIDANVSSMVSSSFDDFISTKVKGAVEKEKEKFLNDLNMCEEEYPVFKPSNDLTEEDIELLKSSLELGYKMVNKEHPDFKNVLSHAKSKLGEGEMFDENNYKEEYEKMYGKILSYYKTLTEYPQRIIDDNEFLIHFHGSKASLHNHTKNDSYGYGISNKGIIYQNIRRASPYYLLKGIPRANPRECNPGNMISSKDFEIVLYKEKLQQHNIIRQYRDNMYPVSGGIGPNQNPQEVILLPNDKFKEERSRNISTNYSKFHLYDISKYIKKGNGKCRADSICGSGCCSVNKVPFHEGSGCRRGKYVVKHTKAVEYEEKVEVEENVIKKKVRENINHTTIKKNETIKKTKTEKSYTLEGDTNEDAVRRYLENDICPDCGAGELLFSIEEIGFDPRVINKYPLNKEYIDILHLIKPDSLEMVFGIQTIYAKYHPRVNENFVIEGKIKKLSDIEKVVEERVEEERKDLEKEKEVYSEKIKQVNEEKLKKIFSMFILRHEMNTNINDKKIIKNMIKHANEKCMKKKEKMDEKLEKEKEVFEQEKLHFEQEKNEYETIYKEKIESLIKITNDINEINELQDDLTCKSDELFNILKNLNYLIVK